MKLSALISKQLTRGIEIIGDVTFRGKCAVEDAELITFRNQLEIRYPQYAAVMLHPKNEGQRHKHQADAERAKGALNTGACDIVLPGFPTLLIEMKRRDVTQSEITTDQLDYIDAAERVGCWACIALGWENAMLAVDKWHKENYE